MSGILFRALAVTLLATTLACDAATANSVAIPDPTLDAPLAAARGEQTAVLAGVAFGASRRCSSTLKASPT
jgi:hypothetical protein